MSRATIAVLLALLAAPAAMAGDYPYSGYFAGGLSGENPDDVRLMCANGFFRQGADGAFVNYHIDTAAYDRDGTIRYVRYGGGKCTLSDGDRIESCRMAFSTDASEIGRAYVDVLEALEPGIVRFRYFDDIDQARAYLAGKAPPTDEAFFSRCGGFTDDALAEHLTDDVSTLGVEERGALLTPDLDGASRTRLEAILDRLQPQP